VVESGDKYLETSFGVEIDSRRSDTTTPGTTDDSPVHRIQKKNVPLNLPDWQPLSIAKPEEDSPVTDLPVSELPWLPAATEYSDEQLVTESPVHAQQKSSVLSEPVDWERLDNPVPTAPPVSFPNITKQILEGNLYETEEQKETEERVEDGGDSYVRRLVKTRRQLLPVSELTLEDGVEVSRTTSEVVVAIHVDEFVDILPQGIIDPHADGLQTETSVEESTEPLEAGGTLTRRVVTTTARRLHTPEISRTPEDWQQQLEAGDDFMQDGKN